MGYDERQKMWAKVVKAGKLDEMVKRLRAHADNAPNDAEAQVALGNALVQKIMSGNISGMETATFIGS